MEPEEDAYQAFVRMLEKDEAEGRTEGTPPGKDYASILYFEKGYIYYQPIRRKKGFGKRKSRT